MPSLLSSPLTLLSLIGYHQQTYLLSIFIVQINMVKYWNGACCLGVHFFNDEGCRPRSHFFKKRGMLYVRILCEGLDFEISLSSNFSLALLRTYMVFSLFIFDLPLLQGRINGFFFVISSTRRNIWQKITSVVCSLEVRQLHFPKNDYIWQ